MLYELLIHPLGSNNKKYSEHGFSIAPITIDLSASHSAPR